MSVLLAFNLRENSDLNISSHFCLPSFSLHMGHACWVVVGASVDGQWQEWSSWSDCSVTCANGTQQRTRQCSAAAHGGSECRGHWAESRECHNPDCTGKILSLLILYPLWCLNSKSWFETGKRGRRKNSTSHIVIIIITVMTIIIIAINFRLNMQPDLLFLLHTERLCCKNRSCVVRIKNNVKDHALSIGFVKSS